MGSRCKGADVGHVLLVGSPFGKRFPRYTAGPSMSPGPVAIDDLQPSQLYISRQKLLAVDAAYSPDRPREALPVWRWGAMNVLTDGHTRALAAWLRGERQLKVYRDRDELDWEAYRICVGWCLEEGIRSVSDLRDRIIPAERYEELWLGRCRRLHHRLAGMRGEEGTDG